MPWDIAFKPEGHNADGENKGGIVVYLVNGTAREEVGRVAFDRAASANPEITFEDQLREFGATAVASVEAINGMLAGAGTLT